MSRDSTRQSFSPIPKDVRRELRLPIVLESSIANSAVGRRKVELLDISTYGCRIISAFTFNVDAYVVITIPDLAPIGAQVRWMTREHIGLRFNTALHPTVVDRVVALSRVKTGSR